MEVKRILLLMISCLCHKGIHILTLCAFYGNVLRKIFTNERWCSRRAHTEAAVNTPLVTEQMTESVHTTSMWPSWNGKSGKPLFIHKHAHVCIQMCLENHFLIINSYKHIQVYISYTSRQTDVHTNVVTHPSMTEGKIDWDNLFCFMPHFCCHELAHSRCVCRFSIDIITTVLLQKAHALMFEHDRFLRTGLPQRDTVDAEIKIPCWEPRADK